MKRQEELSRVSELVNAICLPTSSCTSRQTHPVPIIAACTRLAVMKLSTVAPVPISTTSAVTDAVT